MSQTLLLLRSATAGHVPAVLLSGQVAINEADGLLFFRGADGSVKSISLLLASVGLTGTPTAPTAALGTNTTQIATMAALAAMRNDLVNGAGAALDQFNEFAAALGNDPAFATTIMNALAKRVRVDLDQAFSAAEMVQARSNIYAATFDALGQNALQINGDMEVSQELGTTGMTLAPGSAVYILDMWRSNYTNAAAVVTSAQIAAASFPAALPSYLFGLQIKATTALSSLANGDVAIFTTRIEGYRFARMGWGTAAAKSLSYAFQFYSTAAGVASVRLRNLSNSRAFYQEFNVAVGWNLVKNTIPGDISGTWSTDNTAILNFDVVVAGKDAVPVAPGAWGSSLVTQTTNSTNLLATNNNLCILTGVILLPGADLPSSSGVRLLARPYSEELRLCRRYWQSYSIIVESPALAQSHILPVAMRTAPTITGGGTGFATTVNDGNSVTCSQTTRGAQTLVLNARL